MPTSLQPDHVLIVDDDDELAQLLGQYLRTQGMQISFARDGIEGADMAATGAFDLVVLDVMMPGQDGIAALRSIRQSSAVPVLMFTAKGDDIDKIIGLELGADDYVPKPCTPRELCARIRAILRRHRAPTLAHEKSLISVGPLKLWPGQRRAEFHESELKLTGAEFSLLQQLAESAGLVVSKTELSEIGLGRKLARFDRSIDVHVSSLRHKLADDGQSVIKTVRGQGYMLAKQ